jgi:hypothetical protein
VADREKFEKEFADMWTDFEKEKEKFRREHPDKASKADDGDNGEEFAKYVSLRNKNKKYTNSC